MMALDKEMQTLCMQYGIPAVLAALCRYIHEHGGAGRRNALFNKLNRVYEWLVA